MAERAAGPGLRGECRVGGEALVEPGEVEQDIAALEADVRRQRGIAGRAIAHLLYGHGILERSPDDVLDTYFRQCSMLVTARDLALTGACLANAGVNPVTGVVALKSRYVDKVLSVMTTCGMYDYSGAWIYDVGMPAKSGVGGGIMAVLPGQFGLGVFSPLLDPKGNSVRGIEACKRLSRDFSLHLFGVARATSATVVRQSYDCSRSRARRRRGEAERMVLAEQGHRIRIYELQGELMFGSAESVSLNLLADLEEADHLILDLKRVVHVDDAAATLLARVCASAEADGKRLFLTECEHLYAFSRRLQKGVGRDCLAHATSDRAIEWCEAALLAEAGLAADPAGRADLLDHYLCSGLSDPEMTALRAAGRERRYAAGDPVVRVGDGADTLYFVLEGEADVWIDGAAGAPVLRLTTLGPGMVFGEIGILSDQRRTANVTAAAQLTCLEVPFTALSDAVRTRMLVNMAGHFAEMLKDRAELMQHLA